MIIANSVSTHVSKSYLKTLFSLMLGLLYFYSAHSQHTMSLQQAIDSALKNNLQVKQSRLGEKLSELNVKSSKLALFPTLNANTGLNFSFGRNQDPYSFEFYNTQIASSFGTISTSVPLFQTSQKLKQISLDKLVFDSNKSTTRKVENDLSIQVISVYFQILYNQDLLKASIQQLELATRMLEQEQKQFEVGNKTLVDISQSKAQVAVAKLNVSNIENQLNSSNLALAQLMEKDSDFIFKVISPSVDDLEALDIKYSASEVFDKAVQRYPSVDAARYQVLASAKNVEITRLSLLPVLSVQASVGTGYSSTRLRPVTNNTNSLQYVKAPFGYQIKDNLNQFVGLNLSIPLFNASVSRIAVAKSKIALQEKQLAEKMEANNLKKIINQGIVDLKAAQSRYLSTKSTYEASYISFYAIEQRYRAGLVNSISLNQAQTLMNLAEFELIKAKYELIFKKKIINFYMGEPMSFD